MDERGVGGLYPFDNGLRRAFVREQSLRVGHLEDGIIVLSVHDGDREPLCFRLDVRQRDHLLRLLAGVDGGHLLQDLWSKVVGAKPSERSPLSAAIEFIGLSRLARELGLTHQAIRKWELAGRMPRTEWTAETHYSERIEQLTADRPGGAITKEMLLAKWPEALPQPPDAAQGLQAPDAAGEQAGQGLSKFVGQGA
jgi:hypothetical protein